MSEQKRCDLRIPMIGGIDVTCRLPINHDGNCSTAQPAPRSGGEPVAEPHRTFSLDGPEGIAMRINSNVNIADRLYIVEQVLQLIGWVEGSNQVPWCQCIEAKTSDGGTCESCGKPVPVDPEPPEKAGAAAGFIQVLGGLCFAHGEYKGNQCPKWPACATDPQLFQPTPPPQGPGREDLCVCRHPRGMHREPTGHCGAISCGSQCKKFRSTEADHDWLRKKAEGEDKHILTASHPVEGKARPSCPICNETDITIYEHKGEFFLHCSDNQTHPAWKVVSAESFAQFFRPTLPDAPWLDKLPQIRERYPWFETVAEHLAASLAK